MEKPTTSELNFCRSCLQNVKPCQLGGLLCDNVQTNAGLENVAVRPVVRIPQENHESAVDKP